MSASPQRNRGRKIGEPYNAATRIRSRLSRAATIVLLLAVGVGASLVLGEEAEGQTTLRILQIHPTLVLTSGRSGKSFSIVAIDVRKMPPGYRLRVTAT